MAHVYVVVEVAAVVMGATVVRCRLGGGGGEGGGGGDGGDIGVPTLFWSHCCAIMVAQSMLRSHPCAATAVPALLCTHGCAVSGAQ